MNLRNSKSKQTQQTDIQQSVSMKVTTWIKDSHGLYDYNAIPQHYHIQEVFLRNNSQIYRNPIKLKTFIANGKNQKIKNAEDMIHIGTFHIKKDNDHFKFIIKPPQPTKVQKEQQIDKGGSEGILFPSIVIKDFTDYNGNTGFPLQPGNVIKLGRVEYMVIETKNNQQTSTIRDTNHFQQTNGVFEVPKNSISTEYSCKICLCQQSTPQDPLIAPCNCKGSCQVIHVGCLKTWINSKVKKQLHGIATSYNFAKFQCEICKFPFPKVIKNEDNEIEMMTITKPDKAYIMLQSLQTKTQVKQAKCLHLISTDQHTPIKIGRGHQCQIRVTDISVSRNHAEIFFSENNFYIKDIGSKFGTLVKFQKEYQVLQDIPVRLQYGRSLFEFNLMREASYEVDTQ